MFEIEREYLVGILLIGTVIGAVAIHMLTRPIGSF